MGTGTTYKSLLVATVFGACVFMACIGGNNAQQMDMATLEATIKGFNDTSLAVLLVDYLVSNPVMFQELKDIAIAAIPILGYDVPHGWFSKVMIPWALKHLPDLLTNDEFLGIADIFITELNRHEQNLAWFPPAVLASNNKAAALEYMFAGLLGELQYSAMAVDILQYKSVRDFFPLASTDRQLDGQCYNDTMSMFDRLFHGELWALNMLDAVGKPSPGILRGVLYFIGTYDQCQATHANVPVNASLGQYRSETQQDFQGKYCRATFTPPKSLAGLVAGEHINNTYGLPLTLSWGLCLPDSCGESDIEGLLNLGVLGSWFNLSVTEAHCTEDLDFEDDTNSHIVIAILGGLVLLVVVSSTIELACLRKRKEPLSIGNLYQMSETNFHENNGYMDMPENGVMSQTRPESGNYDNATEVVDPRDIKPEVNGKGLQKSVVRNAKMHASNISVDSDLTENILDETGADEPVHRQLLRTFSIFTNLPAVLSTETKDGTIPCLYGIRVISILWVVLGNTYLYMIQPLRDVPVTVDLMDSFELMKRFTMQAVMSATLATDTFFLISGCLVSYWFLTRKNWWKFYLGRYWKMTPPYMLIMVTFVYLYMYLGQGPIWPDKIGVADACRKDWWKHLLYVSNLVGVNGVPPEDQCMPWSWYLAANMQMYLISPVLLTLIMHSAPMGLAVTGITAVAGIVASGVKEAEYGGELLTSRTDNGDYWNYVFTKPWCRVAPYCVGIGLGFVLHSWQDKKMNRLIAAGCWLIAICEGLMLVYIPVTKYHVDLGPWTTTQQAVYEALGRPVWALCVAWVIYACTMELGGPISDFLSWKGFVPLSRVSFLVFLIHPVLLVLVLYSRRTLAHLSDFEMAYLYIGHVVVNFAAAIFAMLVIDMPFRNLKRIVQRKPLDTRF